MEGKGGSGKRQKRGQRKNVLEVQIWGGISYTHMLPIVRKIKTTSPNTHPLCFQQQE